VGCRQGVFFFFFGGFTSCCLGCSEYRFYCMGFYGCEHQRRTRRCIAMVRSHLARTAAYLMALVLIGDQAASCFSDRRHNKWSNYCTTSSFSTTTCFPALYYCGSPMVPFTSFECWSFGGRHIRHPFSTILPGKKKIFGHVSIENSFPLIQ
jgi:hypothetical protein